MGRKRSKDDSKPRQREKKSRCTELIVYTDGSGSSEEYGASAFVVLNCRQTEILKMGCEFHEQATSNQAEMLAVLRAIEWCRSTKHRDKKIVIYSDSKYTVNGFNDWSLNWRKNDWEKDIKNKYIWKNLDAVRTNVELKWVKAHTGSSPWNTLADFLAKQCCMSGKLENI